VPGSKRTHQQKPARPSRGADGEDHVVALEAGWDVLHCPLQLVLGELGMLREVGLLVRVELDQQLPDQVVLPRVQAFDGRRHESRLAGR